MVMPAAVKQADADADAAMDALEKAQQESLDGTSSVDDIVSEDENIQTDADDVIGSDEPKESTPVQSEETTRIEPDYKQMYDTLKGKYNAEVPRLQDQIYGLQSQMTSVLTSQRPAPKDDAPKEPVKPGRSRYLKKEELDDYGEDILDMQARMAQGVAEDVVERTVEERVAPYIKRIDELEAMVAGSSNSHFWEQIEAQVPGAKALNDGDALWFEFLEQIEPNSGLRYRDIGEMAFQSHDVGRMVKLFKLFTVANSEQSGSAKVKSKPPVKPGKVADSKAQPEKSEAKPVFKDSDVRKFYDDVTRGKYRGRDKAMKAREIEIENAAQEGRIIPG